jgi:sulfite dehydrogenase
MENWIDRRQALRLLLSSAAVTSLAACKRDASLWHSLLGEGVHRPDQAETLQRPMVRFPEKTDLILLTDRPPQLETPLRYFLQDLTPNDAYFVRWHLSGIPARVDLNTWRLNVGGNVRKTLSLSMDDLKKSFEPVSFIAFNQCSGNSRSFYRPVVPGAQWTHGAMGNARWTGVRLKDILDRAGVREKTVEVSLNGLEVPPLATTPDFVKSLEIDHARDGEVMVAYEMNGAPLPMLNGFPARLVVPGWYATYWTKALSDITVLDQPLHNFWMDTAYRIPDNPSADEDPEHPDPKSTPINRFSLRSIFVAPEPNARIRRGTNYEIQGIAVDAGYGIRRVEVSTDGGQSWTDARLDAELGKYSWRRWRASWTPANPGTYSLKVRATNAVGDTQRLHQWNHGGYQRNVIEGTTVEVL